MTKFQFCHVTWLPSTAKLGPSGWVISSGLMSLAELGHAVGGVVARAGRQRPVAVFLDADHLHRVQIDDRPDALDGPGVAVVGRVGAQEAERPGQAAAAVLFRAVIAGAPDIDHHQAGVVDAVVFLQGGLELGAGRAPPARIRPARRWSWSAGRRGRASRRARFRRSARRSPRSRSWWRCRTAPRRPRAAGRPCRHARPFRRLFKADRHEARGRRDLALDCSKETTVCTSSAVNGSSGWLMTHLKKAGETRMVYGNDRGRSSGEMGLGLRLRLRRILHPLRNLNPNRNLNRVQTLSTTNTKQQNQPCHSMSSIPPFSSP